MPPMPALTPVLLPMSLPPAPEVLSAARGSAFPSPWHGAPSPIALAAKCAAEAAGIFSSTPGRRGVLAFRAASGDVFALAHEEPAAPVRIEPGERLPRADTIAGRTPEDIFREQARAIELVNLTGERTTLLAFAESERARRPERIARGGAAGLNLTFEHWNRAMLDALRAPLASCLLALARRRAAGETLEPLEPLAGMEWWSGVMPPHDVKWDGMAIPPRTTAKPLIEWLLGGIPYAADPRAASPVTLGLAPRILREEKDWIAVLKPSGLLSVPGTGGLPNALTLTEKLCGTPLTAVHRLDMDTSGILLYAKTPEGTRGLMAAFREGRVQKRYRALLEGKLPADSGRIDLPITTHPLDRLRQMIALGGRPSLTEWHLIADEGGLTRIEFLPLTGRTHQLRIHAAHPLGLGAPIAGDPFYSRAGLLADTPETPLCLHAAEIVFPDPATGREIRFAEPEPF